jgi:hypothetical protein
MPQPNTFLAWVAARRARLIVVALLIMLDLTLVPSHGRSLFARCVDIFSGLLIGALLVWTGKRISTIK